jgi:hypothetical protein
MKHIVTVLFEVEAEHLGLAEGIVTSRLNDLPVLWQNDSTDAARGTLDPISTYVVVPAGSLLDQSL